MCTRNKGRRSYACHLMALGVALASVKIIFLLFSTNIPRRKEGNLLPINIRIKLLNLGRPRLYTSVVYSLLFYITCFHQGTKTDKKPSTHTHLAKKRKSFFLSKIYSLREHKVLVLDKFCLTTFFQKFHYVLYCL